MKSIVKIAGAITLSLFAFQYSAIAAEPDGESSPYYQLLSPASGNQMARYRYYENGDNPNFGRQAEVTRYDTVSTRGKTQTKVKAKKGKVIKCLFAPCSDIGRAFDQGLNQAANIMWGRGY